uniref:Uncharacterized protein n=1 Tax=Arundo donax TaxID=35708 RepID=A0A0A8YBN2_ARUDO
MSGQQEMCCRRWHRKQCNSCPGLLAPPHLQQAAPSMADGGGNEAGEREAGGRGGEFLEERGREAEQLV